MADNKETQIAESEGRKAAGLGVDSTLTAEAIEGMPEDGPRGDPEGQQPAPRAEPTAEPAPVPIRADNPNVTKRNEILARFREERERSAAEDRDDASEFARSGMPPEFDQEPEPQEQGEPQDAAPPETETQPESTPRMVKVKIRGVEKEITYDEAIAEAQKSLAGESYLEEGRSKIKEIDELLRDARNKVSAPRESQPPTPGGQPSTQPTDQQTGDPPQQEDMIGKLIETMQFGDPNEARPLMESTISNIVDSIVNKKMVEQRLKTEGARSNKVLKDFVEKHAYLANDRKSEAVIQQTLYEMQLEDLKAINVDLSKIPTPSGQLTPSDVAVAHRYYRSEGYGVREPKEMLEKAVEEFLEWKGVKPATPATSDKPAAPRVEVSVDRTARRAAIPQQPSRSATPSRPTQVPASADIGERRASAVQAMMAKRGLPRGRVLG
jgi:hypothetical protein